MKKESQELVDRVLAGDNEACECVVQLYRDYVRRILGSITHFGPAEIDDLQQEVFLRVFTKLPAFHQDSEFSTWIFSITKNVGYDHLRKLKAGRNLVAEGVRKRLPLFVFDNDLDLEEQVVLKNQIDRIFKLLTEDQKRLVTWRSQGYEYKEIEKLCGVRHSTLKVQMCRLRKRLAKKGVTL